MVLKHGDRVILITKRFGNSSSNPVSTKKKTMVGTVTRIHKYEDELLPVTVKWDNGVYNTYGEKDLDCLSHPKIGDKIKDTRTSDIGIVTQLKGEKVYAKWIKDNLELHIHIDDVEKILV